MRILYVSHSFPLPDAPLSNIGGMQRVAVDLHRALASRPELETSALVLETSWRATGIRTGPFLASLLHRIPRLVREGRVDVVLFSSMVTAAVVPPLSGRLRSLGVTTAAIPVGRDLTLPNPIYQSFVPRVLRNLDLVFPISRATAAAALERGASADRVRVVPCGVDVSRIGRRPGRAEDRRDLLAALARTGFPIDPTARLLLSVGRHQERKGFHWFVERVMPRLPADIVYLLAGTGPMTARIRDRANGLGLGDRVHLLGQAADDTLRSLYAGADLFVMPNIPMPGDMEGFGVVMIEAGAAGLPTVAADLEGIRDVITPGENGWLVPSRDEERFAAAITAALQGRDPRMDRARIAAHVRERFSWDSIVERYVSELRRWRAASRAKNTGKPPQNRQQPSEELRQDPEQDGPEEEAENGHRTSREII